MTTERLQKRIDQGEGMKLELVHQEYTNAFPAKLIIEANRVTTENWNKPHVKGMIDPANFSPFPKNPLIARFFKEIGWVDELGSGVRNTYQYTTLYSPGNKPVFTEDDIFKIVIPLNETVEEIKRLLRQNPKLTVENLKTRTGLTRRGIEYHIAKLKKEGKLKRIGSTKSGRWQVIDK